jgi:hypothetical protein
MTVFKWLWQGGLDPFGIFIWLHPLTYISSKIIQRVLTTFVAKPPLSLGSRGNSADLRDFSIVESDLFAAQRD